jgi:homoprotocatechuate degradation regulator HpaR
MSSRKRGPERPDLASDRGEHPDAGAMRPFARSLPMQLMRAREAVMQRFRPHLHAHGLTDQQWRIIRVLVEVPALEILDLSERCGIHPASLSRILPKLDAEGIVVRRPNPQDQRRILVSLAPRGRGIFSEIAPQSEAVYAEIARDIGPERLAELYRLVDEVVEALARPKAGNGRRAAKSDS